MADYSKESVKPQKIRDLDLNCEYFTKSDATQSSEANISNGMAHTRKKKKRLLIVSVLCCILTFAFLFLIFGTRSNEEHGSGRKYESGEQIASHFLLSFFKGEADEYEDYLPISYMLNSPEIVKAYDLYSASDARKVFIEKIKESSDCEKYARFIREKYADAQNADDVETIDKNDSESVFIVRINGINFKVSLISYENLWYIWNISVSQT